MEKSVDIAQSRYPYCVVWTPLPLITSLFPFVGHTGICTSEGIIHDFSGSYSITVDDMAFGLPTKYVQLEINDDDLWDKAIEKADHQYFRTAHDLFFNNCHSHVALALNHYNYQGRKWNMVNLAWHIFRNGKNVGWLEILQTYIIFVMILLAIFIWLV